MATSKYNGAEENFWKYVNKTRGCWLWTGARQKRGSGYGVLCIPGTGRNILAHRLSYEMHYGPISADVLVCHHCDVKPCVRPDHLFLGTKTDNAMDASRKGILVHGMNHAEAKLTDEDVRAIRLLKGRLSQVKIAAKYGVFQTTISQILTGKTWRHVN